jgi:hypothetical protein
MRMNNRASKTSSTRHSKICDDSKDEIKLDDTSSRFLLGCNRRTFNRTCWYGVAVSLVQRHISS